MQEGLPETKFDYLKLATFFCRVTNKRDVRFIDPFEGMVHAHTIPQETVLQVNIKKQWVPSESGIISCPLDPDVFRNSPQPTTPFKHPIKGHPMEHDVNGRGVGVFNVTCRHYELLGPEDTLYAVRLNFYNEYVAQLQETREQDKMYEAAGSIRGAFAYLSPTAPGGKDIQNIPLPNLSFGYQNKQYTKTFMLLDETNLMNGIITIPFEVCVECRLPVWRNQAPEPDERLITSILNSLKITDPEEAKTKRTNLVKQMQDNFMESVKDAKKSTYFYAVPANHVMAWAYGSEAYMAQFDFRVEQFRFVDADTKQTKLLYYLVPAVPFEESRDFFKNIMLGKVDRKPLKDLGFDLVPVKDTSKSTEPVSFTFRSFFTYYSVPFLAPGTIKCLAPTLCEDFPLCHNWSEDEMEMQLAVERAAQQREQGSQANKRFTHKQ